MQNLQEQFPPNLGDGRGPDFIRARGLLLSGHEPRHPIEQLTVLSGAIGIFKAYQGLLRQFSGKIPIVFLIRKYITSGN